MDLKRRTQLATYRRMMASLNTPRKRTDYYRSLTWIHGPDADPWLKLQPESLYLLSPLVVNARVLGPVAVHSGRSGLDQTTLYRVRVDAVIKHLYGAEADRSVGDVLTVAVPSAYRDTEIADDPQLETNTQLVLFLKRSNIKALARYADRVYEVAAPMVSKWAIYPDGHYKVLGMRRTVISEAVDHRNASSLLAAAKARYGLAAIRSEEAFTRQLLSARGLGSVEAYQNAMTRQSNSVARKTLQQDAHKTQ